jgi:hypothetical protein
MRYGMTISLPKHLPSRAWLKLPAPKKSEKSISPINKISLFDNFRFLSMRLLNSSKLQMYKTRALL